MRTAITLVRKHGEQTFVVVSGPEVPIDRQIAEIKDLARDGREHPEIAEAELWTSSNGRQKRFKFRVPGAAEPTEPTEPTEPADEASAPEGSGAAPTKGNSIFRRRKGRRESAA